MTPAPTTSSHRRLGRALTAGLMGACLTTALVACTDGGPSGSGVTAPPASAPVLQPGRPGEPNTEVTASAPGPVTTATASPSDTRFLQEMIVHHAQAIVMVDAVIDDLTDSQVKALADRIRAEQGPEIDAMAGYLSGRGQDVPPEATNPNLTDHAAHSMPGMASDAEVTALAVATGVEADRLFLDLMVRHHQGAVAMVDEVVRGPMDSLVEETAAEISVTQTKQIGQMQEMLDRLT